MILTESKTYTMTVTRVDRDADHGLNKEDVILEYTNLELLHAALTCSLPAGRLSAGYREKQRIELLRRISLLETVLETRGDQLAKSDQTMYLDVSERSAISHYLGMIYTKLISRKLYGTACLTHINVIEQPGAARFVKYNNAYRADLLGYEGKDGVFSVWEAVGRSENSQAAFENGCGEAGKVSSINGKKPAYAAACMTFYERGYMTGMIQEAGVRSGSGEEPGDDLALWFPAGNYFRAYYQPVFELIAAEHPEYLFERRKKRCETELSVPWFGEGGAGQRGIGVCLDQEIFACMQCRTYEEIPGHFKTGGEKMQEDAWYCGKDGISVRIL